MSTLLDIRDLTVAFATRRGTVTAVEKISLQVAKGEIIGIVGESGSGKSVTSYATLGILDRAGRVANGSIAFSGIELSNLGERQMRDLRGRELSMIFQNPRAALNPIRRVGQQIEDVLKTHAQATQHDAREKAIALLRQVRIAEPERRYDAYPFELSGGMCQRIVIALALACQPQLLIADEPTTGLDVTTQKAVMDLVVELTRSRQMALILITHDLGLAAAYCQRIIVMQRGRIVETAASEAIFSAPRHEYTQRLMRATPRPGITIRDLLPPETAIDVGPDDGGDPRAPPAPEPRRLLEVDTLVKEYPRSGGTGLPWLSARKGRPEAPPPFRAVDGISFHVDRAETVGLVGESGCGKSTTSTMIMRLIGQTSGRIVFDGEDIAAIPPAAFVRHPVRRRLQFVFQDPTECLNPRYTAHDAIADPLIKLGGFARGTALDRKIEELAGQVGLPNDLLYRFPHQLSGGQKARVGIARAIALSPDLVILDEPTAALDVSVQAVVLNLLVELKRKLGMSYIFVSHDLNVVRLLCDRVIIMRQGRIVETGPTASVLSDPKSDYTRELLSAIPRTPVSLGA